MTYVVQLAGFMSSVLIGLFLVIGITVGLVARHEMNEPEESAADREIEKLLREVDELLRETDELLADEDPDGGTKPDDG